MPIYSYLCKKCGAITDILEGVNQQGQELRCKNCGSSQIVKQFSSFGVGKTTNSDASSTCPSGSCSMMPPSGGGCCPGCGI